MSDYLCNDCLDTGWIEDREGKTVCACISETEPYQLLRAEVEALRAALQRIADRRYDLCPTQIVHIVNTALRGEGE